MKTNIIQLVICEEKLDREIEKFQIVSNQKAYLIMNQNTAESLAVKLHTFFCAQRYCRCV